MGNDQSENDANIAKLRQFQQQNNSQQQLQQMYSRQGLGSDMAHRAQRNPWEVRNEAGQVNVANNAATLNVQGIQNDFILDKTTVKWLHLHNSHEVKTLNFRFECKAPACAITFH